MPPTPPPRGENGVTIIILQKIPSPILQGEDFVFAKNSEFQDQGEAANSASVFALTFDFRPLFVFSTSSSFLSKKDIHWGQFTQTHISDPIFFLSSIISCL